MKFRNVKVPEGINVSRHNPLADLVILSAGVVAGFAALGLTVLFLGAALGRHMPVSWENALASSIFPAPHDGDPATTADEHPAVVAALQDLADRLAPHMSLPEGLHVTVHYLDDDQVNAFATLGGHVFVLRGLIARMPDENALAMVLAHEIAHVANRDAAAALGGGVMLQLALSTIIGDVPESALGLVNGPNALVVRGYSRTTERQADSAALAAVAGLYGHVAGTTTIFEIILREADPSIPAESLEFLSTHPLSRERVAEATALATRKGWPLTGRTTPLPPALAALATAE